MCPCTKSQSVPIHGKLCFSPPSSPYVWHAWDLFYFHSSVLVNLGKVCKPLCLWSLVVCCPFTEELWWKDKTSLQVRGFNGSGSNTNAAEITINDCLITEREGLIYASVIWEIMRNISVWKLPWNLGVFGPGGAIETFRSVQMLLENPQDKCSYFTSHFPIFILFSFLPD